MAFLKVASALTVKVDENPHKRRSTQRRPDEHLRAALQVPRVRLPAGDVQRGLARDAAVRHSGARSDRLRAVAGAARSAADAAGVGVATCREEEVLDAPEDQGQACSFLGCRRQEEEAWEWRAVLSSQDTRSSPIHGLCFFFRSSPLFRFVSCVFLVIPRFRFVGCVFLFFAPLSTGERCRCPWCT